MRLFRWVHRWINTFHQLPNDTPPLPSQFDVVCNVDLENRSRYPKLLEVPGNLYVSGNLTNWDVRVSGDLFVDGNIMNAEDIEVGGNLCVLGNIFSSNIRVHGNMSVDGKVDCFDIDVGGNSYIGSNLICFDVNCCGHFTIGVNASCADVSILKDFITVGNIDACYIEVGGRVSYGGSLRCLSLETSNRVFDED